MKRRERYWSSRFDRMLFSSRNEAAEFALDMGLDTVAGVPLLPAERPPSLPTDLSHIRLVFIGNLRHTQNMAAFRSVIDHMSARKAAGGVLSPLHVYGRYDPMSLPPGLDKFVVFHGFAETLAAVAADPCVLVAPITFGTGIKTKVFDCMAVGIPVVTTLRGIEGLDVTPGVECAIVDDPGGTYDEAIAIAAAPDRFLRMRKAASRFIDVFHHEEAATTVYHEALGIK
jgi:glycosyltransferase involved in cell wall biosynthesis